MHSSSAEIMLACRQTKRTKKNEIHHDDFEIISTFRRTANRKSKLKTKISSRELKILSSLLEESKKTKQTNKQKNKSRELLLFIGSPYTTKLLRREARASSKMLVFIYRALSRQAITNLMSRAEFSLKKKILLIRPAAK